MWIEAAKKVRNRLGQRVCVAGRQDKAAVVCITDSDKNESGEGKTVKRSRWMESPRLQKTPL